jgi:hypothetical protein
MLPATCVQLVPPSWVRAMLPSSVPAQITLAFFGLSEIE